MLSFNHNKERGFIKMTTTNKRVFDVQLTQDEINTLKKAERIINNLPIFFGSDGALMSAETGECVELCELNRVRAILDFFVDYRTFELI